MLTPFPLFQIFLSIKSTSLFVERFLTTSLIMSAFVPLTDGSFDLCFPMLTLEKQRENIYNAFNKTILQFLMYPEANRANPFACFRGKSLSEKEFVAAYKKDLLSTSSATSVVRLDQCFDTVIQQYKFILIIIGVLLFILFIFFFIILGKSLIKRMQKKSARVSLFDGIFVSISSLLYCYSCTR